MTYWLEFDEITVVPYLFHLDLSRAARVLLARFFTELRQTADTYIKSPIRRLAPGSEYFVVISPFGIQTRESGIGCGLSSVMPPPNLGYFGLFTRMDKAVPNVEVGFDHRYPTFKAGSPFAPGPPNV